MRSFIRELNQSAALANAHGFHGTYGELTTWQRELEQRVALGERMLPSHKAISKAAFRHLQQSLDRNIDDATFARMIRNIRNALRSNEQLIKLVNERCDDNDILENFAEVIPVMVRCRDDETFTLSLEQLLEFNRKTAAVLKNPLNVADADMPAPFVMETAPKPAKPTKTTSSATRNTGHGFFKKLTGWMKDLADPSKKTEDTMMSFMNVLVQGVIQAIGSLFKPFLGPDSEPLVKEFSKHASNAFTRFATEAYSEDSMPSYVPSFDLMQRARAQHEREQAAAAAAPSVPSVPAGHRRSSSI